MKWILILSFYVVDSSWSLYHQAIPSLLGSPPRQGDILNHDKASYEDTTESIFGFLNGKKKRDNFPSNFFGIWMPSLSIAVRNRAKEIDTGHIYVPRPQVQHDNRLHKDCEKLPPFLPITSPDHSRLLPIHGVHPVDEKQHFIGPKFSPEEIPSSRPKTVSVRPVHVAHTVKDTLYYNSHPYHVSFRMNDEAITTTGKFVGSDEVHSSISPHLEESENLTLPSLDHEQDNEVDQSIVGASVTVDDLEVVSLSKPVTKGIDDDLDEYGSKSTTETTDSGKGYSNDDGEEDVATTTTFVTDVVKPESSTIRIETAINVSEPLTRKLQVNESDKVVKEDVTDGEDLDNQFGSLNGKDDQADSIGFTTESQLEDVTTNLATDDFEIITFNTTQDEMENSSEVAAVEADDRIDNVEVDDEDDEVFSVFIPIYESMSSEETRRSSSKDLGSSESDSKSSSGESGRTVSDETQVSTTIQIQETMSGQNPIRNAPYKADPVEFRGIFQSLKPFLDAIQTFPQIGQTADQVFRDEILKPQFGDFGPSLSTDSLPSNRPSQPSGPLPKSNSGLPGNQQWTSLGQLKRHQCTYTDSVSFPCSEFTKKSLYKPKTVHQLKPGDIEVIGAIGDGLISGMGALSMDIRDAATSHRGVSFATGGESNWRTVLSIPNIIHEFNPRVLGLSLGHSSTNSANAGFNMGESQAFSSDLMTQAQKLISKLKRTLGEETNEKWKLIFVLAGQNDLCRLSCNTNSTDPFPTDVQTPTQFATNVKLALEKLIEELPRTFVALVLPPDPSVTMEAFNRPLVCHMTSKLMCPCVDGPFSIGRQEMRRRVQLYREALTNMVGTSHVNDRFEDFAAVIQPGLEDLALPRTYANFFGVRQDFLPDMSFLAPDCFHPSQKLHALIAKVMWNNLLEPVGLKSTWNPHNPLSCPTKNRPYLATNKNSDVQTLPHDDERIRDSSFQRYTTSPRTTPTLPSGTSHDEDEVQQSGGVTRRRKLRKKSKRSFTETSLESLVFDDDLNCNIL